MSKANRRIVLIIIGILLALVLVIAYGNRVLAQTAQNAIALPVITTYAAQPNQPPTFRILANVAMPYACLGGDTPIAVQDASGGWVVNCFRIDSAEGSGAAPVYWREGETRASPINVVKPASTSAEPQAQPISDCRGAPAYGFASRGVYYFSWDCTVSGRRPSLVVSILEGSR